jgi:hypothetical protein
VDILNNLQLAKISTNNDIEIWIKQLVATLNALEKLSSLPNQKEARRQKMIVKSKEGVGAIAESNVSNSEASESASAHIAIANDSRQIKSSGIEGQLQDVRNQIDVAVNPLRAVLKNYSTDKLISLYPFAEQVAPLFRDVESILLKIAAFESMSLDDEQSAVVENMHKVMMSCKVALKGAQEKIWTASSVDARKSVRNDLQRIVAMMDELPKAPSAKTFEKKRLPKRRESTVGSESNPKKIGKSGADKARETSFVSKPAVEKINFHRPHEEMAPAVIAEAAGRILKKWKREKKLTGKEVLRDLRNILNEWIDLRNLDLERGIKPLSGNFDKLMSIYTDVERAGTSNEKFGVALSPAGGVLEAIRSSSAENN